MFHPEASGDDVRTGIRVLEELLKFTGLTWKNCEELVEQCDEPSAQVAAREVWSSLRMLRRTVHEAMRTTDSQLRSANPLALFGDWGSPRAVEFWARAPERMTPAQMLGALFAVHIIAVRFPEVGLQKLLEKMLANDVPTSNESE